MKLRYHLSYDVEVKEVTVTDFKSFVAFLRSCGAGGANELLFKDSLRFWSEAYKKLIDTTIPFNGLNFALPNRAHYDIYNKSLRIVERSFD